MSTTTIRSRVIIVLADGFEEIEAVVVIDLLRRAGIEVLVLGLDNANVTNDNMLIRGARDIYVKVDAKFSDFVCTMIGAGNIGHANNVCPTVGTNNIVNTDISTNNFDYDAIVLPGGMPGTTNLAASEKLLEFIRVAYNDKKICAAICAAPSVLAKAGILNGKTVTCYPGCESMVTDSCGGSVHIVEDTVVIDDNIITSRSVGTAIPFALELIRLLAGAEVFEDVKGKIKIF